MEVSPVDGVLDFASTRVQHDSNSEDNPAMKRDRSSPPPKPVNKLIKFKSSILGASPAVLRTGS